MKTSFVKDYLKCAYANKFTLAGFIALAANMGLKAMGKPVEYEELYNLSLAISHNLAFGCLVMTWAGLDTFRTYKRTREYIQEFGKIREDYSELKNKFYCSRVGIRLAAKEAGLERTLVEKNK